MSECENNFHLHDNAEGLYGKKSVKTLLGNWLWDVVLINSDKNTVIWLVLYIYQHEGIFQASVIWTAQM